MKPSLWSVIFSQSVMAAMCVVAVVLLYKRTEFSSFVWDVVVLTVLFGYLGSVLDMNRISASAGSDVVERGIGHVKRHFYQCAFLWGFLAYMGWAPLPGYLTRRIDQLHREVHEARKGKLLSKIAAAVEIAGQGKLDMKLLESLYGSEVIDDWEQTICTILDAFHGYIEQLRKETSQPSLKYVSQTHLVLDKALELSHDRLKLVLFADGESSQAIADSILERFRQASELANHCDNELIEISRVISALLRKRDWSWNWLFDHSTEAQVRLDSAIEGLDGVEDILALP